MIDRRELMVMGVFALAAPARAGPTDYANALGRAWGAPLEPRRAHAAVVGAARKAQARADQLLRGQGLSRGSVAERLRALSADVRWLYPDDDAGRDRAVADMNARLAAL